MNEVRESAVITQPAPFPMCHTDSNTGGRFRSSRREASVSPQQITDHVQGHMTHSEGPIRRSHLNEVVYQEKIAVEFKVVYEGNEWDHFGRHE
jgi:hypothetical protein